MSIGMRMSLANAQARAAEFFAMLKPADTCARFEWAGSLRRLKADVGDFDAVAIVRFGDVVGDDMFSTPTMKNILWHRIDELLAAGQISKHVKEQANGERTKWVEGCRADRGTDF